MAKRQKIRGKQPVTSFCTNRSKYFTLSAAKSFDAAQLLAEPDWQLFALDFESRDALFVKTAPGIDLFQAPFLHQELYDRATEIVTLPFADFVTLSQQATEPKEIVHLLSIGRCGSTLAHHLFHNAHGVLSVSEPDTYIGLAMVRSDLHERDSLDLLRAAGRFHFVAGARRGDHTMVVKHHSQSLFMAERLRVANPDAKFIFMYREGESWANSVCQMAQSYGFAVLQDRVAGETLWHIMSGAQAVGTMRDFIDAENEDPQGDRWIAALWGIYLIEYLRLWDKEFKFLAIDYHKLNSERLVTVQRIFRHCGLSTDHLEQVLTAFDKDSQAGTSLAKDRKLAGFSETNYENFRETLARFKSIKSPRMILPSL